MGSRRSGTRRKGKRKDCPQYNVFLILIIIIILYSEWMYSFYASFASTCSTDHLICTTHTLSDNSRDLGPIRRIVRDGRLLTGVNWIVNKREIVNYDHYHDGDELEFYWKADWCLRRILPVAKYARQRERELVKWEKRVEIKLSRRNVLHEL